MIYDVNIPHISGDTLQCQQCHASPTTFTTTRFDTERRDWLMRCEDCGEISRWSLPDDMLPVLPRYIEVASIPVEDTERVRARMERGAV